MTNGLRAMDLELVTEQLKAEYREGTPRYRLDDEIEVQTANHRHLWNLLRELCLSFEAPITALDAGCGTGRYFHCLENVRRLVGVDVSPDMLKAAENPVLADEIKAPHIDLICENIFRVSFPPATFDFIYSLGMFGHGCPVTVEICERFFQWLKPGGKLFFDAVNAFDLPLKVRVRKAVGRVVYRALPKPIQRRWDARRARLPLFALSRSDLETIMESTSFPNFEIATEICDSPLWDGIHLECLALKT
jgi:SAM-dependent methyltransferase